MIITITMIIITMIILIATITVMLITTTISNDRATSRELRRRWNVLYQEIRSTNRNT